MRRNFLLTLSFIFFSNLINAQGFGEVRFVIDPGHNYKFILDNNEVFQVKRIELSEGVHNFKFWAPERIIVDTNLTIKANSAFVFYLRMPFSDDYTTYQKELKAIERKERLMKLPITFATGILAINTTFNYFKYKKSHDNLVNRANEYDAAESPGSISGIKSDLVTLKDDFASQKSKFTTSATLFSISLLANTYLIKKANKLEKPRFHDKFKVQFEQMTSYDPSIRKFNGLNLTYQF